MHRKMTSEDGKSRSSHSNAHPDAQNNERDQERSDGIALPAHVAGSGTLDRLVDTARDYAKASTAENTNKAYAADWKHFGRWCRIKGSDLLPPSPEMIGLYLADLAAPVGKVIPPKNGCVEN
jgi:hypothetical protein